MVPGMTERERLATDARRVEWLADTRSHQATPTIPDVPGRGTSPLDIGRRGLSAAFLLGQRVRSLPHGEESLVPDRAAAPAPTR